MIEFNDVKFEYNSGVFALDGISMTVAEGEFVAVIGHNGSGKSTIAKHVNALLVPTSGTVTVKGMRTDDPELTFDIRQRAGMVFQNPDNQLVTTIVEEDVAFGPENLGIPSAEIRKRVDGALAATGMSKYAQSAPHMLSGGQKQRIAIAGILAMHPEIVVFDEPTAMLDPHGRKEVLDAIIRLNREEGITVVLITHFMEEAAHADRIVVVNHGKIVVEGEPSSVFERVEELQSIGLDVPFVVRLGAMLREKGIEVDHAITEEGMVAALCRLFLKN